MRWRAAAGALAAAERHPFRASAFVAWVVVLGLSVAQHPSRLWARQGEARGQPLVSQRWGFFTRDPSAPLLYVADAPRGQTLDRRHREELAELRSLAGQLPPEPTATTATLHGRIGMLVCGHRFTLVKTNLVSIAHDRQPKYRQTVEVSC